MQRVSHQKNPQTKTQMSFFKKVWHFLWYEDSVWSWIANIIIAFILIKFIVYPALSFMLSTSLPVVAVVSGSMEHKIAPLCDKYLSSGLCLAYSDARFEICGQSFQEGSRVNSTDYWKFCGKWYDSRNITQNDFSSYSFSKGFNTGDVMIVRGKSWENLQIGDVIVWFAMDATPIIHRVVAINQHNGIRTVSTKGDHNADQITTGARSEVNISKSQYVGVAVVRIPYLGYVKLFAAKTMGYFFS